MFAQVYLRQSTVKQQRSGLGIEAQRATVNDYVKARGLTVRAEHVETESGRLNTRPILNQALRDCQAKGDLLVVANVSRLARNAAFCLSLRDSGVSFVCCDLPDANRLTIGLMALLAEQEADLISQRTSAALQAKKRRCLARGESFFSGQGEALRRVQPKSVQVIKQNALARRQERLPSIRSVYETAGGRNFNRTAKVLQDLRVPTLTGRGVWTATGVRRLMLS